MSRIDKYYNKIKKKYLEQGFHKYKKAFIREKGEVIQNFCLKHYQFGPLCTIEFGIQPLCCRPPIYLEVGSYDLDRLAVVELHAEMGWLYDPNSEDSMTNCIEKVSEAIDRYVIPLFDRCIDSETTLKELLDLEDLMENNRLVALKLMGWGNGNARATEPTFFDDKKYFLAMKAKNYEYLEQYLRFQIEYLYKSIQRRDQSNTSDFDSRCEWELSMHSKYTLQLEQLQKGNFDFFEAIVLDNEEKMRKYLRENYPTIWKT